jgi:hypothetical protein
MWRFQKEIYKILNSLSVACNATTNSGGEGVTEYIIELDKPLGGIMIMDFNAQSVPDKLEIIHNSIKKATSGMTVANEGPFDDLYGDPTVPTNAQATNTDQFIGLNKGTPPNRDSVFLSETSINDITRVYQQLIWWVYTEAEYNVSKFITVRVTGIVGTAWDLKRLCTNQTPTPAPPTMTQYSYTSVYERDDSAHPNGGTFTYVDVNGTTINYAGLWSDTCFTFSSQSAPTNLVGIATCTPQQINN